MKAIIYDRYLAIDNREYIPVLVAFCKQQGFEIYKVLYDEGLKPYKEKLPKYQELMDDVRDKKFNILVCRSMLGLSRGSEHVTNTLKIFIDNGIHFIFLEQGINSLHQSSILDLVKAFVKFHDDVCRERGKVIRDIFREENKHYGKSYKINTILGKDFLESTTTHELADMFKVSRCTALRYRKRMVMEQVMKESKQIREVNKNESSNIQ